MAPTRRQPPLGPPQGDPDAHDPSRRLLPPRRRLRPRSAREPDPVPGPALATRGAIPRRARAGGCGRSRRGGPLLLWRGQRRRVGEHERRAHVAADLRHGARGLDRSARGRAVESARDLRRHGRGRHAVRHRAGQGHLPLGRRRRDVALSRPRRHAADRPHPGGPARRQRRVGRRPRPPLRPERGARRVPDARRRAALDEGARSRREHGRHRRGARARRPAGRLRRALAGAAHAVEHLPALERPRLGALQVHRRRGALVEAFRQRLCRRRPAASASRWRRASRGACTRSSTPTRAGSTAPTIAARTGRGSAPTRESGSAAGISAASPWSRRTPT